MESKNSFGLSTGNGRPVQWMAKRRKLTTATPIVPMIAVGMRPQFRTAWPVGSRSYGLRWLFYRSFVSLRHTRIVLDPEKQVQPTDTEYVPPFTITAVVRVERRRVLYCVPCSDAPQVRSPLSPSHNNIYLALPSPSPAAIEFHRLKLRVLVVGYTILTSYHYHIVD